MGGVRHSREQWLLWISDQQSSGMTIVAFCESVGIRENSFYRWRAKLAAEGETFVGTTDDGGALANGTFLVKTARTRRRLCRCMFWLRIESKLICRVEPWCGFRLMMRWWRVCCEVCSTWIVVNRASVQTRCMKTEHQAKAVRHVDAYRQRSCFCLH